MRVNDRLYHSLNHHCLTGIGGRGRCGVVLANGLPTTTKINWAITSSTGIPEPAVYHPRANGRTKSGLPHVVFTLLHIN